MWHIYLDPTHSEQIQVMKQYLVGLKWGRVQDRLFEHEPCLANLPAATEAAYQEWALLHYTEHVFHDAQATAAVHEPMEVNTITSR